MWSQRFPLFLITWLLMVVWFQSGDRFVDGSTGESRASLKGPVSAVMPVSSASDIYSTIRDQIESRRQNNGATGDLLPVVTLCYAQTIDGSIAPEEKSRWEISSPTSWQLLHSLRSTHRGVLIGVNTVRVDQPRLNVRMTLPAIQLNDIKQPRPIILDTELSLATFDGTLSLQRPIIVTCSDATSHTALSKLESVHRLLQRDCEGGDVLFCKRDPVTNRCDLHDCLLQLKLQYGIDSLLVEGGASILQSFLETRSLITQVVVTIKPWYLGGYRVMTRQLSGGLPLRLRGTKLVRNFSPPSLIEDTSPLVSATTMTDIQSAAAAEVMPSPPSLLAGDQDVLEEIGSGQKKRAERPQQVDEDMILYGLVDKD